jgi:hypothetical protein
MTLESGWTSRQPAVAAHTPIGDQAILLFFHFVIASCGCEQTEQTVISERSKPEASRGKGREEELVRHRKYVRTRSANIESTPHVVEARPQQEKGKGKREQAGRKRRASKDNKARKRSESEQ